MTSWHSEHSPVLSEGLAAIVACCGLERPKVLCLDFERFYRGLERLYLPNFAIRIAIELLDED